jgi:iron complex transport system ATP-binding protein
MELIRDMNQIGGKTVVMVLHDMNLALNYADNIILMNKGRIRESNLVTDQRLHERIGETFGVKIQSFSEEDESRFYFVKR